jgi:DNA-directed RNA polymerase specialized sigma subunit
MTNVISLGTKSSKSLDLIITKSISERKRLILVMYINEDLSFKEIAKFLGAEVSDSEVIVEKLYNTAISTLAKKQVSKEMLAKFLSNHKERKCL